jgi:hypothetical protein
MSALGRIVQHDPRSWNFQAERAPALVSVLHERKRRPLDQGQTGDCTGMAMTGLLCTKPFPHSKLSERTAIKLYSKATTLDDVPGSYPPDDTGSSGLAVAKAAKHYGYIKSYSHAFGLQHALEALVLAPVICGFDWYEGFDQPDSSGNVTISGSIRGGHEVEVLGLDVEAQTIQLINSWGDGYGVNGRFQMSWSTFDQLLSQSGDVTTCSL